MILYSFTWLFLALVKYSFNSNEMKFKKDDENLTKLYKLKDREG